MKEQCEDIVATRQCCEGSRGSAVAITKIGFSDVKYGYTVLQNSVGFSNTRTVGIESRIISYNEGK